MKQHCFGGGGGGGGVSCDANAKVLSLCQMRGERRFVARCPKDFCRRLSEGRILL